VITAERLRAVLRYEPETGFFQWIARPAPSAPVHVGERAGYLRPDGYLAVMIDGRSYKLHRLAWLYMTGEWPPADIDHRNRVRDDNRWRNLRDATPKQNRENQSVGVRNRTGILGVSWSTRRSRWRAWLGHHGRYVHLGEHDTLIDAVAARLRGERGTFTHLGAPC
jgi:hypothetical protein